jgi:FeS assembly SUF system regulator
LKLHILLDLIINIELGLKWYYLNLMIKMNKMTDYGIVLLTTLARSESRKTWAAKDLSQSTRIPLPTVGKILKLLSHGDILTSSRGSLGGYRLSKNSSEINLAQVIQLLEGPSGLTDCSGKKHSACSIQSSCLNKTNWQKINSAIYEALGKLTLADMSRPLMSSPEINLGVAKND